MSHADGLLASLQASLGDGYSIERELGGGGMSRVFLTHDRSLGRRVVVKVLSPELAQGLSVDRFAREIKLAAALQDPHIVPVLSAGATRDGLPYYTMPFVDGESLRARLSRGRPSLQESLGLLRDVLLALESAHRSGVVHRDIKPENVLLSGRTAVVADFGIAKAVSAARTFSPEGQTGITLTSAGSSLGTPAYMAPEQAVGDATDHRADLYAWGVMAYEVLSGTHPFSGKASAQQLMMAHLSETPPALAERVPGLAPPVGALVMHCLAKVAEDRPASAAAVLESLDAAMTPVASPMPAAPSTPRPRSRVLVVGTGVLLAVALGATWIWSNRPPAVAALPSLAVLPFEHQGDSADRYLTEGITDEIRGRLTSLRHVIVIARGSSNAYRATTKSPQQIAEELNVRFLLTGTVQVVGTRETRRVIVRPALVEVTRDGQPQNRWQQGFDAVIADAVAVQGNIAGQVADAMQVEVSGGDRERVVSVPTRDAAAWDLYLRGRAAVNFGASFDFTSQRRAIPLYEQAIARDSAMIDAWAALQNASILAYVNGAYAPEDKQRARAALERLRALAPGDWRTHRAAGGYYRLVERDFPKALPELKEALRLAPNEPAVSSNLAYSEEDRANPEEALRYLTIAERADPRSGQALQVKARVLAALGRMDEARQAIATAQQIAPTSLNVAAIRVQIELAAGDTSGARRTTAAGLQIIPEAIALPAIAYEGLEWLLDPEVRRRIPALDPVQHFDGDRATWALVNARYFFRQGDSAVARAWGDTAVRYQRALVQTTPDQPTPHADLAASLALAGRSVEALAEVKALLQLTERIFGTRLGFRGYYLMVAARTATEAGDRDAAIAYLTELMAGRTLYTRARLQVDQGFATLRADPRFQRLTADPRR